MARYHRMSLSTMSSNYCNPVASNNNFLVLLSQTIANQQCLTLVLRTTCAVNNIKTERVAMDTKQCLLSSTVEQCRNIINIENVSMRTQQCVIPTLLCYMSLSTTLSCRLYVTDNNKTSVGLYAKCAIF